MLLAIDSLQRWARFYLRVVVLLAGIVTTGFMAWAGVVWTGWQDLRELVIDVAQVQERLTVTVDALGQLVERVERDQKEHEGAPWHQE